MNEEQTIIQGSVQEELARRPVTEANLGTTAASNGNVVLVENDRFGQGTIPIPPEQVGPQAINSAIANGSLDPSMVRH